MQCTKMDFALPTNRTPFLIWLVTFDMSMSIWDAAGRNGSAFHSHHLTLWCSVEMDGQTIEELRGEPTRTEQRRSCMPADALKARNFNWSIMPFRFAPPSTHTHTHGTVHCCANAMTTAIACSHRVSLLQRRGQHYTNYG